MSYLCTVPKDCDEDKGRNKDRDKNRDKNRDRGKSDTNTTNTKMMKDMENSTDTSTEGAIEAAVYAKAKMDSGDEARAGAGVEAGDWDEARAGAEVEARDWDEARADAGAWIKAIAKEGFRTGISDHVEANNEPNTETCAGQGAETNIAHGTESAKEKNSETDIPPNPKSQAEDDSRIEEKLEPRLSLWEKCTTAQKIYMGILAAIVLLNLLSWSSTAFCDFYVVCIFPIWVNTYGRFSGIFPFSIGEWLLGAGLLVLVLAALCGLADLILFLFKKECPAFMRNYLYFFAWTFLIVCLIMTLNCFMLYHVSPFSERYLAAGNESQTAQDDANQMPGATQAYRGAQGYQGDPEYQGHLEDQESQENQGYQEYTLDEFLSLRNKVAERCNQLSDQVLRDKKGYIIYFGSVSRTGESLDMPDKAREEMHRLGELYPQLGGYYPRPKPLLSSDFLCQQNMLGWYFPFSMEANYNDVAYVMNLPATMCHELAHLKGFIYEDEANFIGYLACVQSNDIYFEYSGYLSVLGYLEQDLRKARLQSPENYRAAVEAQGLVELKDAVYQDDIFVTDEEWERIEGKAFLDTETVSKATDTFVDTTLKVNGVEDGMVSYSRVVELMLQYERMAE